MTPLSIFNATNKDSKLSSKDKQETRSKEKNVFATVGI